jgi:hypothetical protein
VSRIFKKGDKHASENYRPMSLTSVPCKLLEHVICKHMLKHLEKHKMLTRLWSNLLWGTVSNAFEKSRIATSVWSPASYDFMKSCSVTNSCVSHEYPDLNPWFNDVSILCFSRCFSMCLQITCSSNLHGTDVSDIGL